MEGSSQFVYRLLAVCRLVLPYFLGAIVLVNCCKSKRTLDDFEDNVDWHDSTTEPTTTEFVPPPVRSRYFVGLALDDTGVHNATAIRVLPNVLLTAKVINDSNKQRFRIHYMDDDGMVLKEPIHALYTSSKADYVVVRCKARPDIKKPPGTLHQISTIPIATRTDPFKSRECELYAVRNIDMYIVRMKVILNSRDEYSTDPNRLRATANIKTQECFQPAGSALVCDERLAGIRLDTQWCIKENISMTFSNMRYEDFWPLSRIYPGGYYDYELEKLEERSRSAFPRLCRPLFKSVSLALATIFFTYSLSIIDAVYIR
ncbi:hypothetical protein Trydic_g14532 [Trypoxylus dichotomus]